MKKGKIIIGLALIGVLGLSLGSCGNNNDSNKDDPTGDVENEITVTYVDGAKVLGTETVNKGGYLSANNINTAKDGYTFVGWFTDENLTTSFDFATSVNNTMKLYAKYDYMNYTINFDTDGGYAINAMKYNITDKVSLPIASKNGYIFSHWVDDSNKVYHSIPQGSMGNLNLKAVYNTVGEKEVEYQTKAESFSAGSLSKVSDSIFTYNGEIRGRIQTWTNPKDIDETITWEKSFKVANATSYIELTASGNGTLSIYVQNSSSNADTGTLSVVTVGGTTTTYSFSGKTAVGDYSAGSPVVKIEIEVVKGATYKLTTGGKTIDIYEVDLVCDVAEEEVKDIALASKGQIDFIEGTEFSADGFEICAVHGENLYTSELDIQHAVIDSSNVDMTTPGVYEVEISYGQFNLTYNVNVYDVKSIELGFNSTYESSNTYNKIFVNGKVQTIYSLNEKLNTNYLTVTALTELNGVEKEFIVVDKIDYSGFDSSKAGEQNITVTYTINGTSHDAKYSVYVVDTNPYQDSNNNYVVTVDKNYTGVIGAVNSEQGNMFTTISQALEYLEQESITATSNKILNVSAGLYNEKIEINIPNLTIVGAGTCKATCNEDENYVEADYNNATIIEWNSLYGIADEAGYSQVTDSTATVAVRESATNCIIKNVTLSNYWNCEAIFQKNLSYLVEKGIAVGTTVNDHRALALIVQADKFTMDSCSLLGYQDTVEFMTGRQFVYNTYISGNTDYIFGTNATTYFYECNIHVAYKVGGSGYITAYKGCNVGEADYINYGFIFDKCQFTADSNVAANSFALGRPWGPYSTVMVMNSEIGGHVATEVGSRYVSMGGVNPTDTTVRYYEYNNTGASAITATQSGVTIVEETSANDFNNLSVIYGIQNGNVEYSEAWLPSIYNSIVE